MKKILILLSILLVVGTACSSGPTKQRKVNGKTITEILSMSR